MQQTGSVKAICLTMEVVLRGYFKTVNSFAINVLNLQQVASKSSDAECEILRDLCHQNLTKVITSYSSNDFKALVLDNMPKWEPLRSRYTLTTIL